MTQYTTNLLAFSPCNSDTIQNNSLSSLSLFSQIKGAIRSGIQDGVDVKWLVISLFYYLCILLIVH